MKKVLLALTAALVCIFGCMTALADEAMVKVGLKYGTTAAMAAEFESDYGLNFFDAVTGQWIYTSEPKEKVTVTRGQGFEAGGKFSADTDKLSVQSVNSTPITYDSDKYRGYFLLDISGDKNITVINIVHMNQYLYSVLGREMSASFSTEALKAQAVCAKNFVLGEKGRHSGFDVCASTHCQVYSGMSSEAEATIKAVDEVGDAAAYYNGEIVPLYFFATSGGQTEDAENVWGTRSEYLLSVSDPYEPADKASRYTWSTTLTKAEVEARLAAKGINIGSVTGISVDEVTDSGRVSRMTFHGTAASKTVVREACRTTLGTDKLYSQRFTVSSDGGNAAMMAVGGTVSGSLVLTANGAEQTEGRRILSADGISEFFSGAAADSFTFDGKGYGHGVGMSQWGAYGMAEEGFDFVEILEHYFTGITIK